MNFIQFKQKKVCHKQTFLFLETTKFHQAAQPSYRCERFRYLLTNYAHFDYNGHNMKSTISATKLKHRIADVLNETYFNNTVTVIEKHGKPVAKIVPLQEADTTTEEEIRRLKREAMKSTAGAFKGTELEDKTFWDDVLKKHSRKTAIKI